MAKKKQILFFACYSLAGPPCRPAQHPPLPLLFWKARRTVPPAGPASFLSSEGQSIGPQYALPIRLGIKLTSAAEVLCALLPSKRSRFDEEAGQVGFWIDSWAHGRPFRVRRALTSAVSGCIHRLFLFPPRRRQQRQSEWHQRLTGTQAEQLFWNRR